MIKAVDFEEVNKGDLILVDLRVFSAGRIIPTSFQARMILSVDEKFRTVQVQGMDFDISPNSDDQYIIVE